MEVVAHVLWASAAVITAKRWTKVRIPVGWTVWWAAFPDVLAFGPSFAVGLWLRLAGNPNSGSPDGHIWPHAHIGIPLYPAAHSLVVFLLVFALAMILARRVVFGMLGWLLHIVIDIPTHSLRFYATRFLWPVSDYRVDDPPRLSLHVDQTGRRLRKAQSKRVIPVDLVCTVWRVIQSCGGDIPPGDTIGQVALGTGQFRRR